MADERTLPKTPPRHPSTGPVQADPMPEQPRPPIGPSPKQKELIEEKEREKKGL